MVPVSYTHLYKVMCETPGILGNQYLGDLIPIDYISGLELAKLTALLIPGEDEEDTEHLRTRYFESFDSQAFGGNVKDYKEKVNSLHGVGGVKVYREWNGDIRPADFCPPDSFQGWFSGLGGETPREVSKWLDIINKAATEGLLTVGGTVRLVIIDSTFSVPSKLLVDTVQTHIDPLQNAGEGVGIAPIGHVVKVEGVGADTVNFRFNLTYRDGWTGADVEAYVKEIIHEYFTELAETWANQEEALVVRISQVESRLLGIEGVLDVADTTINGVASNYTLPLDYIPILGTITV